MKKQTKKKSSKHSKVPDPQLPTLVEAMAKLVERLEGMERKMDQVLGRVANLPSDIRNAVSQSQQVRSDFSSTHSPQPVNRKERMMYKAICADCCKECEVPFKPGNRPVYCKECFTIRKAGHVPQNPDAKAPQKKPSYVPSALGPDKIPTLPNNTSIFKTGKQKSGKHTAVKAKKKKR